MLHPENPIEDHLPPNKDTLTKFNNAVNVSYIQCTILKTFSILKSSNYTPLSAMSAAVRQFFFQILSLV